MFALDDSSSAVSTYNGVATANGLTLTGTAYYSGKQASLWANMAIRKIGRTTGETSGQVTNTCTNIYFPFENRRSLCQVLGTYASSGGDSGSPVWYRDASGNRWVMGIHSGTVGNSKVFSYWGYAWSELANDILARYGVQWAPSFTSGPFH